MRPRGLLVVLVVALSLSAALTAASGYQVSSDRAIDVPERTVDVQQQSHTIDSMIRARAGDQVTVSVDAPEEVYRLHIRNSEERIEASKRGDGSDTFTYDLSGYEPGSYAVSPYADGVYQDVLPLLVSGYEVAADAPSEVEQGDQFQVAIDVSRVDTAVPPEPAKVQAVLAGDGEVNTVEASASGSGYVATVDASSLDAGEYTLYGIAQGEEEAFGRQELLGQSDGRSLTVREGAASTPPSTDNGDRGAGDGTEVPPPTTSVSSPVTPPSTTVTPTSPPEPPTDSGPGTTSPPPSGDKTGRAATQSATSDGSGESAITPRTRTGTPPAETTGDGTPGFTVLGTAVAVLVALLLLGRR
ncbi:hypothetical protein [Salinirussus salinus]|uniref:hypothetical protein n=1 Tax=Salinirussus salinus TaxID=1198300 RepID=UPI00135B935E|nr:hypothetical protein [Salinirussus salinus]